MTRSESPHDSPQMAALAMLQPCRLVEEIGEGNWSAIARALNAVTGKVRVAHASGQTKPHARTSHMQPPPDAVFQYQKPC
jgi:hypothetical protein